MMWYPGEVQVKGAEMVPQGRPGLRDLDLASCNPHLPAPLRLAPGAQRTAQPRPEAPRQTWGFWGAGVSHLSCPSAAPSFS